MKSPRRGARVFGDKITIDVISQRKTPKNEKETIIDDTGYISEALLFYDLATGWLEIAPLKVRSAHEVARILQHIMGRVQIKEMSSDRAPEFIKAAAELLRPRHPLLTHVLSLPGEPQTNYKIERQVQVVSRGTRALLAASGLPQAFWMHAASTFCFL